MSGQKYCRPISGCWPVKKPGLWDGKRNWHRAVEAGVLVALAMLSHGGVAFGFVGFVALLFGRPFLPRLGHGVWITGACVLLMLPWSYWQNHEDPPGNALLKSALAGSWIDQPTKSLWASVRDAYAAMTFDQWLHMKKWFVLGSLNIRELTPEFEDSRHTDAWDTMRPFDILCPVGVLGIGNLGWLFVLLPISRCRRNGLRPGFASHSVLQASS